MHACVTDVDAELATVCAVVTRVGVTASDFRDAELSFSTLMSQVTRPLSIDGKYYGMDHRNPNIDTFFRWLIRAESAESAQDLSSCLMHAHSALKSAAAVARWTHSP